MPSDLLQHFTEAEIRHELRGFPEQAVETILALKQDVSSERLQEALLAILSFYLPRGVTIDLSQQDARVRLREDLGVDSLTFAEAAFKMEELFQVRIENAELVEIQTLGELQTFVEDKLLNQKTTFTS